MAIIRLLDCLPYGTITPAEVNGAGANVLDCGEPDPWPAAHRPRRFRAKRIPVGAENEKANGSSFGSAEDQALSS